MMTDTSIRELTAEDLYRRWRRGRRSVRHRHGSKRRADLIRRPVVPPNPCFGIFILNQLFSQ
jgi:hypothetical protein